MLEFVGDRRDAAVIVGWRKRVDLARVRLGWSERQAVARPHGDGTSLAIAAPCDQLFTATEINEWALCAALAAREPSRTPLLRAALVEAASEQAQDAELPDPPEIDEHLALAQSLRCALCSQLPTFATCRGCSTTSSFPSGAARAVFASR